MKANEIISIRSDAFYELIDCVIEHISTIYNLDKANRWVSAEECMRLLNIRSRTTLLEMRAQGKIAFSQVSHKNILYDRQSILAYIQSNKKETF